MKNALNTLAFVIIGGILLIAFLGAGLSQSAGKPLEPGILATYGFLLVIFVWVARSSFGKQEEKAAKNQSTFYQSSKKIYYGVLVLGLIIAIGVALLSFLTR